MYTYAVHCGGLFIPFTRLQSFDRPRLTGSVHSFKPLYPRAMRSMWLLLCVGAMRRVFAGPLPSFDLSSLPRPTLLRNSSTLPDVTSTTFVTNSSIPSRPSSSSPPISLTTMTSIIHTSTPGVQPLSMDNPTSTTSSSRKQNPRNHFPNGVDSPS